jgi:alkanesulfonate monooxygenase SsuD/methylene tetrahydromethanopterin reductase-like flavin-dependent oxidoreductase (luciferase family)
VIGTAEDVADQLDEMAQATGVDGFIVSPAFLPDTFEDFVREVVPILQARGLFRRDYGGKTLRHNIGSVAAEL